MPSPTNSGPEESAELRGNLTVTRLTDVLHHLNEIGGTGTLEVMKMPEERLARLRLRRGRVTRIIAGDQEGPRALENVLGWAKGLFRFHPAPDPPEPEPPPQTTEAPRASASLISAEPL